MATSEKSAKECVGWGIFCSTYGIQDTMYLYCNSSEDLQVLLEAVADEGAAEKPLALKERCLSGCSLLEEVERNALSF